MVSTVGSQQEGPTFSPSVNDEFACGPCVRVGFIQVLRLLQLCCTEHVHQSLHHTLALEQMNRVFHEPGLWKSLTYFNKSG